MNLGLAREIRDQLHRQVDTSIDAGARLLSGEIYPLVRLLVSTDSAGGHETGMPP